MAISPEEKERILNARKNLKTHKESVEKQNEVKVEEDLNRKHGKLLFISGIVSISGLILFCVIMLSLLLSGGDGFAQLMSVCSFYENVVKLLVLNLTIKESVIYAISMILSIATIITGFVMASKVIFTSRQKIVTYLRSTSSIIVYVVFTSLLALMILFTIIKVVNFILILVLAGFVLSIVFAIVDLVKTKKLYKEETSTPVETK